MKRSACHSKSGQIDQILSRPIRSLFNQGSKDIYIQFVNSIPEDTVFKATESCMDESQLAMAPT